MEEEVKFYLHIKKQFFPMESAQREPSRVFGGWELFWGG